MATNIRHQTSLTDYFMGHKRDFTPYVACILSNFLTPSQLIWKKAIIDHDDEKGRNTSEANILCFHQSIRLQRSGVDTDTTSVCGYTCRLSRLSGSNDDPAIQILARREN